MNITAEELIVRLKERIVGIDPDRLEEARRHLDDLTKPLGSLGRLEEIAAQMYALRGAAMRCGMKKAVYVFAADHGITAEGVSAYPAEVTRQMVENFLAGGAAINVLARAHGATVHVVDVGVNADLEGRADLLHFKVRHGSRNMLHDPAMTSDEVAAALVAGAVLADAAAEHGVELLAIGEMGIGNTTAASAITAALTGSRVSEIVGRGTGLTDQGCQHKQRVIVAVLNHHFSSDKIPVAAGPLEIIYSRVRGASDSAGHRWIHLDCSSGDRLCTGPAHAGVYVRGTSIAGARPSHPAGASESAPNSGSGDATR
jgi:nicotinate-nucleotide--dimethylbenzimidazole phosphoribosyltransferase